VRLDDLVPVGSDATTAESVEWRPAQAEGTYLEGGSFLVVNRSQGGTAGSNLITPMQLDDGRVLLVNRGFLALDDDLPPTPAGRVAVAGHCERRAENMARSNPRHGHPALNSLLRRVGFPRAACYGCPC
jgi:cytochrome oxidase assembly protein ShyY1